MLSVYYNKCRLQGRAGCWLQAATREVFYSDGSDEAGKGRQGGASWKAGVILRALHDDDDRQYKLFESGGGWHDVELSQVPGHALPANLESIKTSIKGSRLVE